MKRFIQNAIMLAMLLLVPAISNAQTASLENVSGTVELRRVGQDFFVQAMIGQNISPGDILRTGINGKAVLSLVDGSTMSFSEESEFILTDELSGCEENLIGSLLRGVTRAVFNKRKDSFISTPTGTVGIRGTDITISHSGKSAFYFLDEGGVEVRTDNATLILRAGNMTASYEGHKPLPPSPFAKSAGLAEARSTLSAMTSVEVPSSLKDHALLNEILTRWIINYANYLADSGQPEYAETALLIAEDLTKRDSVKGDILLQISGLYFYHMNDAQNALKTYQRIIHEYRENPSYENALFGAIRCCKLLKQHEKELEYKILYKKQFPNGKHLNELESLSPE